MFIAHESIYIVFEPCRGDVTPVLSHAAPPELEPLTEPQSNISMSLRMEMFPGWSLAQNGAF